MRVGRAHLVLAPPKIFSAEEPALRMLEIVDYECRPGVSPRAVGSLCYVIASERWSAVQNDPPAVRAARTRHSEQRTIASKSLATRPLALAWIAPVTSDAEPKATAAPWP